MAEPKSQHIDGAALERLTGLTDRRHRQIAKEGYFPPPKNGMYEMAPTIRGLFKYYAELRGHATQTFAEEKLKKLRADRELAELKLEQGRREVVSRDVIGEILGRLAARWDQLLTLKLETEIPARIVGKDIVDARAEARAVHDEIREICNMGILDAHKEVERT